MDGTLIDTVDMHARAWKEAFEYFGREFSFEMIRSQIGKGGDQLMPVFLSEGELAAFGKDLEDYRAEHWKKNYLPKVEPFPMVRDLFQRIKRDGKRIILASSSEEEELSIYKRIAKVSDLIDGEVSANDVAHSKPAPDIFQVAMQKTDIGSTSEAVVVGDSPFDAEAAEKIGLATIGVRSGGFSDEVLREAGVVEIYNGPEHLLQNYDASLIAN